MQRQGKRGDRPMPVKDDNAVITHFCRKDLFIFKQIGYNVYFAVLKGLKSIMQEQRKKLFSYAIIMLVAAVLILLIAYMSENRADMYESELLKNRTEIETTQAQIAQLTNDNYELKKQNEKNIAAASDFEDYRIKMDIIKSAWDMHNAGDDAGALTKLSELDRAALDDAVGAFYDSVTAQIQPTVLP